MNNCDLAIIGGGPAGCTAAVYGVRAGLRTVMFTGDIPGGQLLHTSEIENFPGFPQKISGYDLMEAMLKQAEKLGAARDGRTVKAVNFRKRPFELVLSDGSVFTAGSVIVCTGSEPRKLGLSSEEKFYGHGVSVCATCDAFFYKGKKAAVVGGGETAVADALFLSKFADKVFIIHRRDKLRASYSSVQKLEANPKIKIIYDSVLEEIEGKEKVTGMRLKNVKTGNITSEETDGIFIAVGYTPQTEIFRAQLKLDGAGYIAVDCRQQTSEEGVFAAGDCSEPVYKQAIIAAGTGAKAAMSASEFLNK